MESVEDLCKNLYDYQNGNIEYSEDSKTMFYENEIKLTSPIPIPQEKCEYEEELSCSFNTYMKNQLNQVSNLSNCNDCTKGILFGGEVHYLNN